MVILAFEAVIYVHQAQYYAPESRTKPKTGIIFREIRRPDADVGLVECAKFFANYCFYKFGLEVSYLCCFICFNSPRTNRNVVIELYSQIVSVLFDDKFACHFRFAL